MSYKKILLCGLRNTGKTSVFWHLQEKLNLPTFSVSQFLRDYIRIHGLQGASDSHMNQHDEAMRQAIKQRVTGLLVADNPVIVETRVLENIEQDFPETLKVLLTATDETRVNRNAFRESISVEKSAQRLIKKENKWLEKVKQQFGRDDFLDAKHYQLVIETDKLSIEAVADLIIQAKQPA